MKLILNPPSTTKSKCLVLIGGVGDPAEIFDPLVTKLVSTLTDHVICTFTFSQQSQDISLLEKQSHELQEVIGQLINEQNFKILDLWCTSMGSYATVKALLDQDYAQSISHAIFFDPADYYLDDQAQDVEQENTWSGYQQYNPSKPTVSSTLPALQSNVIIDVVHLVVRNHSSSGYLESDYNRRSLDNPDGFPRLNTEMVKAFYTHTPQKNRGKYLEINNLPHAIFRDGNVTHNLQTITNHLATTVL